MKKSIYEIIDHVRKNQNGSEEELLSLLLCSNKEAEYLYKNAREVSFLHFGNGIYVRALIEISSYCKKNCYYCGLRRENECAARYRLSKDEILDCAINAYKQGFKTIVLQGGEDGYYSDEIVEDLLLSIKEKCPGVAITLSLGEKSKESYKKYALAGCDRYLLRHESIVQKHYEKLHPQSMSLENRIQCLYDLKELGIQVGAGMMIGAPYQKVDYLVEDIRFLQKLKPAMIGIGPYIPHKNTPFKEEKKGDLTLTLNTLAILRLLFPKVLIPSTTALATLHPKGRSLGILAGANVVMPNATLLQRRKEYNLYDNKASLGAESVEGIKQLQIELEEIGYKINFDRGDYKGE